MGVPNIIIVLSPTLQTSPAVLAIMLNNVKEIFGDITITKLVILTSLYTTLASLLWSEASQSVTIFFCCRYVRPQEEELVIETAHEPSNVLDVFNTPEYV